MTRLKTTLTKINLFQAAACFENKPPSWEQRRWVSGVFKKHNYTLDLSSKKVSQNLPDHISFQKQPVFSCSEKKIKQPSRLSRVTLLPVMQSAPSISFLSTSKKHCNYIAGYVPETFEIYGKTGHTLHTNLSRKRGYAKTLFKPVEFENAGFAS